ncbi:MAG: SDR family oxidoreductase, partial [Blastomonas fulva]
MLRAAGLDVDYRAIDLTDEAAVRAMVQSLPPLAALVNNAGVMPLSPLASVKRDEWKRMIDVNINGVLNGIASVLPRFTAQRYGHVINVASIGAHMVVPTAAVYC